MNNDTQQLIRQLMRENLEAKLLLAECKDVLYHVCSGNARGVVKRSDDAWLKAHIFLQNFRVLRWEDTRPATGHTIEAKVEVVT